MSSSFSCHVLAETDVQQITSGVLNFVTRRYISSGDYLVIFRKQITFYLFCRNMWRTAICIEGTLARKNKSQFLFLFFQSPLLRKIVLFTQNCISSYFFSFEPHIQSTVPYLSLLLRNIVEGYFSESLLWMLPSASLTL